MPLRPHPTDPDVMIWTKPEYSIPLQTPREWQGLTEQERLEFSRWAHIDIIEDIETKLKERNS